MGWIVLGAPNYFVCSNRIDNQPSTILTFRRLRIDAVSVQINLSIHRDDWSRGPSSLVGSPTAYGGWLSASIGSGSYAADRSRHASHPAVCPLYDDRLIGIAYASRAGPCLAHECSFCRRRMGRSSGTFASARTILFRKKSGSAKARLKALALDRPGSRR